MLGPCLYPVLHLASCFIVNLNLMTRCIRRYSRSPKCTVGVLYVPCGIDRVRGVASTCPLHTFLTYVIIIHTYTHVHTCTHAHTCTHMYTFTHMYTHIHTHARTHIFTFILSVPKTLSSDMDGKWTKEKEALHQRYQELKPHLSDASSHRVEQDMLGLQVRWSDLEKSLKRKRTGKCVDVCEDTCTGYVSGHMYRIC